MPNPQGWPDATMPGVPRDPHRELPHLVVDQNGKRRWAWWVPGAGGRVGTWKYSAAGGPCVRWTYIGPAESPDGLPVD
jgi:hypothetical protein